jgi:hypothetical protein
MVDQIAPDAGESKAAKRVTRKFWFAVCSDMFGHEIVGAHVQGPKPAEPGRQAWAPIIVWLWLIKEAARADRERVIKGRVIPLRRGQLAVSLRYLAREANWGVKAVRVFLERLQKFGMVNMGVSARPQPDLDRASSKRGTTITVLTICNYDAYQRAPEPKGTRRAQQGHSRGTAGAQDSTVIQGRHRHKDHHQSDPDLEDDDRLSKRRAISPSIVQALTNHAGQERSAELTAEYLSSTYARNAKVLDKAFIGWLKKTYGVVISGAGSAMPDMAEIIAMCGKDKFGRPDTKLPSADQLRARRA